MKMKFITALLFILPALAFAGSAPEFTEADTNADGLLSEAEFSAAVSAIDFKSADQNGDGSVDRSEYAAVKQAIEGQG